MKILRLHLQNLNSLRGTQVIDFEAEPLASSGLYAIVGPTGAGKTSILDAITLALYGRTERDRYGNEVMSHGTGDCFAEVEFRNDKGRFLSRWERRRARSKPGGKLQTAERAISKWDATSQQYLPLAVDGLKGVNEKVEDLLGLDYGRFVRSVMLTQGQFARFLNSDVGERSGVLERITGTEIYSRISEAAFIRHKLAKEAYQQVSDRLEQQPPLSADDRKQLQQQLQQLERQTLHLRPRLEKIRQGIAQQQRYRELTETLVKEEEALATHAAAWKTVAPERDRLAASLRLQPMRNPLQRFDQLELEAASLQNLITENQQELSAFTPKLEAARVGLKAAEDKRADHLRERPGRLEKLDAASELKKKISGLQGEALNAQQRWEKVNGDQVKIEKEIKELATKEQTLVKELGNRDPEALLKRTDLLEKRLRELDQAIDPLLVWRTYDVQAAKVKEQEKVVAKLGQAAEQVTTHYQSVEEAEKKAEATRENREKSLRRTEQVHQLDHLRTELAPGEQCPICGATEHPALVDFEPVEEQELILARKDLAEATESLRAAREATKVAAAEQQKALTGLAGAEAQLKSLAEAAAAILPKGDAPNLRGEALFKHLDALVTEQRNTRAELQELQLSRENIQALQKLRQQLVVERTFFNQHQEEIKGLMAVKKLRDDQLGSWQKDLQALIGNYTVADCRQLLRKKDLRCHELVEEATKGLQLVEKELTTMQTTLNERQKRLAGLKAERATLMTTLEAKLQELAQADLMSVRKLLLPLAAEETLRVRLQQQEQALASQRARHQQIGEEVAKLKKVTTAVPPTEALETELATAEQSLSTHEREIGAFRKELEQDDQRQTALKALAKDLEARRKDLNRWAKLHDLIGQKDGTKFRRFAQTLTLQRLVEAGNYHLAS
ncbi:MAG: AAA family ATPase, partial [Bacteroidota bacterium]